jgi:hypothetical protein
LLETLIISNQSSPGRITAAAMKFVRQKTFHNCAFYKTNTEIAKELNISPVLHRIQEYIRNCFEHNNGRPGI